MVHFEPWCNLQQLTSKYWQCVDRVIPGLVDELYVEGGIMQVDSLRCEGRGQIRAYFLDRNMREQENKRTTRHVVGALGIESISSCRYRIRSTVQVLSGFREWPMQTAVPSTVADFEDIVVRTPRGSWLFESRIARVVFESTGTSAVAR